MPAQKHSTCRRAGNGVQLHLHVRPGAKRDAVAGWFGESLKIELKTPPVDGRANAALIRFLAEELNLPRVQFAIKSGECCRDKILEIAGCPAEKIETWIQSKC